MVGNQKVIIVGACQEKTTLSTDSTTSEPLVVTGTEMVITNPYVYKDKDIKPPKSGQEKRRERRKANRKRRIR